MASKKKDDQLTDMGDIGRPWKGKPSEDMPDLEIKKVGDESFAPMLDEIEKQLDGKADRTDFIELLEKLDDKLGKLITEEQLGTLIARVEDLELQMKNTRKQLRITQQAAMEGQSPIY